MQSFVLKINQHLEKKCKLRENYLEKKCKSRENEERESI
jgi:hypothetical protein